MSELMIEPEETGSSSIDAEPQAGVEQPESMQPEGESSEIITATDRREAYLRKTALLLTQIKRTILFMLIIT